MQTARTGCHGGAGSESLKLAIQFAGEGVIASAVIEVGRHLYFRAQLESADRPSSECRSTRSVRSRRGGSAPPGTAAQEATSAGGGEAGAAENQCGADQLANLRTNMPATKKLQVFVSSTYTDLKAERQAAVEAILKSGHIPAGMELFAAGNESQMETIRRWIDDSDVYMLILGARYGSVDTKTSLSYTELEYDYAVSTGKPVFAVVITEIAIDNKLKIEGKGILEAENPKELKFFREKVLSRTSTFFADTKDIKLAVHETLADYTRRMSFTGWVSGKDIVDTAPLLEDIARLREENESLKTQLADSKIAAAKATTRSSGKWSDDDLRKLMSLLAGIDVSTKTLQADQSKPPQTYSVLQILVALRDTLVTGVTNRFGGSESENFLFFNVFPKLEIHELAALEKVAGVQWQRYRLTAKGKALLAYIEHDQAGRKQKEKASAKRPAPKKS